MMSLSESDSTVGQTPVKWSSTEQNKQAGWCHSIMGTLVQTEEWSWEQVPEDAGDRGSEGGTARSFHLLHYWNCKRRGWLCTEEQTERQFHASTHQQDRENAEWTCCHQDLIEMEIWRILPTPLLWLPHPALCRVKVSGVNISVHDRGGIMCSFFSFKAQQSVQ